MNGWFLAIILIQTLSVGIHLSKHGEPKNNVQYNFVMALVSALISIGLTYMAIITGL